MNRKHRFFRTAVFLLGLVFILLSILPASAASLNAGLIVRATAIESALTLAFTEEASELSALAAEYRAGTKTPTDKNGNPLDPLEAATMLESAAAGFLTITADYYALAIVEDVYEDHYLHSYKSMTTLAADMADVLFVHFDLFRETGKLLSLIDVKAWSLAAVVLVLTRWIKRTKNLHPIVFILASAVVGVVFRFAGV